MTLLRSFLAALISVALVGPLAAQTVDTTELMKAGPLPEQALGSEKAPVTIVDYASLTCGHCAAFHERTFPTLKEKYIDTGKVRFILREFPLDPLATGAIMLARCAPPENFFKIVDALFVRQSGWAHASDPKGALFGLAKQMGFTEQSIKACLTDQKLLDNINAVKQRGAEIFGVSSTPTFFINGVKKQGGFSPAEMDSLIPANGQ